MATNFTQYGPWVSGQVIHTLSPAGLSGAIFTIPPGVKKARVEGVGFAAGGPALNTFFNGNAATREVYITHFNNAGVGGTVGPNPGQIGGGGAGAMDITINLLCMAGPRKTAQLCMAFDDGANLSGFTDGAAARSDVTALTSFELRLSGGQVWGTDTSFALVFVL